MLEAVMRGDELTGPHFVRRYGSAVQRLRTVRLVSLPASVRASRVRVVVPCPLVAKASGQPRTKRTPEFDSSGCNISNKRKDVASALVYKICRSSHPFIIIGRWRNRLCSSTSSSSGSSSSSRPIVKNCFITSPKGRERRRRWCSSCQAACATVLPVNFYADTKLGFNENTIQCYIIDEIRGGNSLVSFSTHLSTVVVVVGQTVYFILSTTIHSFTTISIQTNNDDEIETLKQQKQLVGKLSIYSSIQKFYSHYKSEQINKIATVHHHH
ncbi:hypothetical protein T10_12382 [Trichinella papuae]|uniref:Uncharacterized protein n=1 Tax=Trichinella papuae TaxID=268474 RepID=A0A0V1M969_9BILA|nr:hypothetical protein T10_12382 [Trichinella papuae]